MGIHVPEPRLEVPEPSAEAYAYAELVAFRIVVEGMIEDLILLLDIIDEPTVDMEEDDAPGHDGGRRDTVDDENSLAATEAINQDHAWTQGITERWHGCADLEVDDADDEPSLGSVNMSEHDQTRWAASSTSDIEEENEHGTEIDHGELDESDREPSLGSTNSEDQTRWAEGDRTDRELVNEDGNVDRALSIHDRQANSEAARAALNAVNAIRYRNGRKAPNDPVPIGNLILVGMCDGHGVFATYGGTVR